MYSLTLMFLLFVAPKLLGQKALNRFNRNVHDTWHYADTFEKKARAKRQKEKFLI